ncbi:MAG: GNAT family N-acetyltransferase [Clostridia bacterium]|nr:GNAT family N-acetyltransferase [Clostridia bacterium]
MMNRQDFITIFDNIYPHFFEGDNIRNLSKERVCEEMVLSLDAFDPTIYDKKLDDRISFGFYTEDLTEIQKKADLVSPGWGPLYNGTLRIYCGYMDGEAVSFCLIDEMGTHCIGGKEIKVGGPGCVGTLPAYRHKGIGLMMVKQVTQILKDEGYDISFIHYTGVAPWYEKLGYKTVLKWNRDGFLD